MLEQLKTTDPKSRESLSNTYMVLEYIYTSHSQATKNLLLAATQKSIKLYFPDWLPVQIDRRVVLDTMLEMAAENEKVVTKIKQRYIAAYFDRNDTQELDLMLTMAVQARSGKMVHVQNSRTSLIKTSRKRD